jgi:valyl-tRNA synthetase
MGLFKKLVMDKKEKEKPLEQYNPKDSEKKWKEFWETGKIYAFNPKSKKKIYAIDTPPPTVSGKMHIGHALSYSQQDFVARFRRMAGNSVFYPFGTDDNGLPTERLVEKINNVRSKNMPRADFIKLCLSTLKKITPEFTEDWKRIGVSADYNISYSTIDSQTQKISQKSFLDLLKKGLIYQKAFPSIWCPECQTAIAQAELEDKEESSLFSTLRFTVDKKDLLIATTRPELLPACVAVFINPEDKRYKKLAGKKAKVPLFNFEVPILLDKSADMEKGTGVLMICSYGDKFDVDAINRHKLTSRVVLNKNGTLNELAGKYTGLKIKEARKKILEDLKNAGLVAEQKPITHALNVHDKCGTCIEFLPTEQWFIKILEFREKLIEQGRKIKWHPEFMLKRYENWINGLDWDWNISRERHFGIPIPVWQCEKCGELILPEEKELPVDPLQTKKKCPKCKKEAKGEEKVLDTWATSSLTPEIASNLVDGKVKIPFSLRPQAHDIIRTWAFYTITRAYLAEKEIPWKDIMVSGFVTLSGEKMSKSKGNTIDPQIVLEKYSADALRYWAAGSKLGEDLDYQENDILAGSKFVTKLFNATKFVFMNLGDYKTAKPKALQAIDRILLNELNKVIKEATTAFNNYDYAKAKSEADNFFWKTFCDNYLEIVKNRIYNGSKEEKESAKYTLYNALLSVVKMMAPITPFITEEVYQKYFFVNEKEKSVHLCSWSEEIEINAGKDDEKIWLKLAEIIDKARRAKSEAKKSMKAEIILTITSEDKKLISDCIADLRAVTNAKEIKEGKELRVEII